MREIYWRTFLLQDQQWTLFATENGLCRILIDESFRDDVDQWLTRHVKNYVLKENDSVFDRLGIVPLLEAYYRGEQVSFSNIPLDLIGTPFQCKVWNELANIPYGEIRTYRDVATAINHPKAVRAVGAANGANPLPIILPCHRVIGSNSKLTGYRFGLQMKSELLSLEGIQV